MGVGVVVEGDDDDEVTLLLLRWGAVETQRIVVVLDRIMEEDLPFCCCLEFGLYLLAADWGENATVPGCWPNIKNAAARITA